MEHDLERIARNRAGVWVSSLLLILLLAGFVALAVYLAPQYGAAFTGRSLLALSLLMAAIPALIWLVFFYVQDRLAPEPKSNLAGVFLLCGLMAAGIGQPVIERLFQAPSWMYYSWWVQLLTSILVIGFVQEFVVYAAVRYSIYRSRDFDERVDGMIYAIAAGLGYATVLNFQYVLEHGGVDLGIGAMTVAINALAHAGFAGIIGYALGQAKFERTPTLWLAYGVALAALLNGVFFFLEDQVTLRGMKFTPINGVILAGVFAFVILTLLFFLISRANAETRSLAQLQATQANFPADAVG